MLTSRRPKSNVSLVIVSFLIGGLIFQGIQPTPLSYATSTITSDRSMRTTVTQVGTTYNIDGGKIRGTNQFHSFGLFSVGTGDTASFNGPANITNIISRVTGGQQSVIDGILKSTITGANLYLLNPYGVLFGKNASLDVSGSFHVSTADYLRLSDGGIFYSHPLHRSALTTAPPVAFGFLRNNVAPIAIQGSFLQVPKGKTLSMIGGDINITNESPGYLYAPCGQINIVGVASPGEVNLSDLSTNSFSKLGNITILNILQPSWNAGGIYADGSNYNVDPGGAIIIRGGKIFFENTNLNARGNPGGTLSIKGEQLHLDDTYISTGTRGAVSHPGTAVDINVTGNVLLTNGSEIASSSYGAGRAGDIRITAGNIQLGDDDPTESLYKNNGFYGDIGSRSYGAGRGGDIYFTADNLTVENGFIVETMARYTGDGGDVIVRANSLKLLDHGQIASSGFGLGRGGVIDVVAKDILISDKNGMNVPNCTLCTGLCAQAGYSSPGGLIRVEADTLQILDGGHISTVLWSVGPGADAEITAKNILISGVIIDNRMSPSNVHASIDARVYGTYATGNGGSISVVADSLKVTNGGFIASSLFANAPGNSGNVTVKTGNLELSDGGGISASSVYGTGNSGHLDITAKDVSITGIKGSPFPSYKGFTGLSTGTNAGSGGVLILKADNLLITDLGEISSGTVGSGKGGTMTIELSGGLLIKAGGTIWAGAEGAGDGGNIKLTAGSVTIDGTGQSPGPQDLGISAILSSSTGEGKGGNIEITTPALQVLNGGLISASTFAAGNGGDIDVSATQVFTNTGARISAGSSGSGNAGNIDITTNSILMRESSINTEAKQADGGNIHIDAGYMVNLIDSKITASVGGGPDTVGGNITIDPRYVILNDSQIIANAYEGKGGNIRIIADVFLASPESIVDASSALGIDGTVDVRAPITNLSGTLAPMQGNFLSTEALLRDRCIARIRGERVSSFVVSGRDGLPIRPGNVLPSPIY